jgi:TM2 domain-containing membrane protein YozV
MTYREEAAVATLNPGRKHCFACASVLDVRAELCPKCGVRQPQLPGALVNTPAVVAAVPATRSKTTAGLFALLLGGIGAHKFYLGRVAAGVLYILFCWTLIPAFIAFIEALLLFGMSDAEFSKKFPG